MLALRTCSACASRLELLQFAILPSYAVGMYITHIYHLKSDQGYRVSGFGCARSPCSGHLSGLSRPDRQESCPLQGHPSIAAWCFEPWSCELALLLTSVHRVPCCLITRTLAALHAKLVCSMQQRAEQPANNDKPFPLEDLPDHVEHMILERASAEFQYPPCTAYPLAVRQYVNMQLVCRR